MYILDSLSIIFPLLYILCEMFVEVRSRFEVENKIL